MLVSNTVSIICHRSECLIRGLLKRKYLSDSFTIHTHLTLRRIFGTTSLQIRLLVWLALVNNLRNQLSLLLQGGERKVLLSQKESQRYSNYQELYVRHYGWDGPKQAPSRLTNQAETYASAWRLQTYLTVSSSLFHLFFNTFLGIHCIKLYYNRHENKCINSN